MNKAVEKASKKDIKFNVLICIWSNQAQIIME